MGEPRPLVQRYGFAYLLLAPALIAIGLIALYPASQTLWISLFNRKLILPGQTFVGLGNFQRLLNDDKFWNAWTNTIYFTFATVVLETLLGLAIALVLNQEFRGRGLVRAAVLVPWAIPTVVSSRLWSIIFNTDWGIANYLLQTANIIDEYLNWLGDPDLALNAAVVVDVWKTTPFMALILLAGLQTIPGDLHEAAAIDGAGPLSRFFRITVPLLLPVLLVAMLLRLLDAYRVFDVIYVMTGGGPGDSSEVMSTYTYKTLFSATNFGYGSTLAAAMFVTLLSFAAIFMTFLRNRLDVD